MSKGKAEYKGSSSIDVIKDARDFLRDKLADFLQNVCKLGL